MGAQRIGLTGGLAAGKSTVGRWLEEAGIPVLDADRVVAELYRSGAPGAARVQSLFGNDFLLEDGGVDRPRLAALVFSDDEARRQLEEAIHPLVRNRFEEFAAPRAVAVLEATLLVESGLNAECDLVITVEADPELRLQRASGRGMDAVEAQRRLKAQGSGDQRRDASHHVLWNNGSLEDLRRHLDKIIDQLKPANRG